MRLRLTLLLVLLGGLVNPSAAQEAGSADYDVVIRNGRVLDGAGNPWIRADVAIRDGRIVAVGAVAGEGTREIDAAGRYVAPGFIDMMDQSGHILRNPTLAENKLHMGVTSAIGGEGGTPVQADSVGAYFEGLEAAGIPINFGSYFSATQTRVAVIGPARRPPTEDELQEMRSIMATAMKHGAIGMTTALIYPPSSFAETDELVALAEVAGEYGGIYASHIRDEGAGLVGAVEEAIEIGERARIPVEVFHFKAAYAPGWGQLLQEAAGRIEAARARGVDVAADIYPYTAGGTGLEATIPSWAFDGGIDSARARIARPEVRARWKEELVTGYPGWWNIVEAVGGWDRIVLVNAQNPELAHFEGKDLATIAEEWGKEAPDAAWDIVAAANGRVMAVYHMMNEDDVRWGLQRPWVSVGSDAAAAMVPGEVDALGLAHPRSYGTFSKVLATYVRDEGLFTLEEAVRKMTSWPATRMRLKDRGMIATGNWADIVVFDLEKVESHATYDDPFLLSEGMDVVLVNGTIVLENGEHTGARPGHVLYGQGRQP